MIVDKIQQIVKKRPRKLRVSFLVVLAVMMAVVVGRSALFSLGWFLDGLSSPCYLLSLAGAFVLHFCFWFGLLLISANSRIFAYLVLPIIVIVQFMVYYAKNRYGAVCEELSVAVYNASWGEVLNYLNVKSTILFCVVLFSLIGLSVLLRVIFREQHVKMRRCVLLLGIGLSLFSFAIPVCVYRYTPSLAIQSVRCYIERDPWRLTFPVRRTVDEACMAILTIDTEETERKYEEAYIPVWDTCVYVSSLWNFLNPADLQRSDLAESFVNQPSVPKVVVLYIGESFRADHSPLNGYSRNTLPNISKMANIINLPNLHCLETQTISSIYSFLVLKDKETRQPTHTSFFDVLVKHGYQSFMMVGMNGGTWYNTPLIAPLFKDCMTLYCRPESADGYPRAIRELRKNHTSPLFVMIEDGAGHMPYESTTYPFGTKDVIDRFDNAMVDIDMTVTGVIDSIKDTDAILFFTSDHGESFGENGRWGHGGPKTAKEQLHVCGFIWYSDSYAKNYPDIVKNLRQNADRFRSLDYLYHTIISMSGISSTIQDKSQDMTLPQSANGE